MRRLIIALAVAATTMVAMPATAQAQAANQPNIIFVMSDDQRWDTLAEMQVVQNELIAKGVNFTNAHQTTPLCCPSRSTILSGQYAHNHGVWGNNAPYAFPAFNDDVTIATVLDDAGYRTGLFGKYLNGYPAATDPTYIPPGWDQWRAITSDGKFYYNYDLNENGQIVSYGSAPEDYLTDVLFNKAGNFVTRALDDGVPFLAYLTPVAPHYAAVPEAEYEHDYDGIPVWRPASYNENDVSDKPSYVRNTPKLTAAQRAESDKFREDQYESLQSVDEDLGQLLGRMTPEQLHNTLVIFTSDNGYFWGEHRLTGKNIPYQEALRAPLVMRWDNAWGTSVNTELAANMDYAATMAEAAGTTMPNTDGTSLLATAQSGFSLRDHHVIEGYGRGSGATAVPPWCGIQWRDKTYVRYATGEEEFYNLTNDPLQRSNKAALMQSNGTLAQYRQVAKNECVPTPPGFSW